MEGGIERSPADVLRLVVAVAVALALLLVEWLFGDTLVGFASDLLRGSTRCRGGSIDVVVVGTRILARRRRSAAGSCWALFRRRWRLLVTVVRGGWPRPRCSCSSDSTPRSSVTRDARLVDVGVELGPLERHGFPDRLGIGAVAAGAHRGGAMDEPRVAARRLGAVIGDDRLRLPRFARVVRVAAGPRSSAGSSARGAGGAGAPSRRPTAQAVIDGLRACRSARCASCTGGRRRPRVDAVLRRRRGR